jgi:hypothetical protein
VVCEEISAEEFNTPDDPRVFVKVKAVEGLYDFPGTADGAQVAFTKGEQLTLCPAVEQPGSGWFKVEKDGKKGIVPANYVKETEIDVETTPAESDLQGKEVLAALPGASQARITASRVKNALGLATVDKAKAAAGAATMFQQADDGDGTDPFGFGGGAAVQSFAGEIKVLLAELDRTRNKNILLGGRCLLLCVARLQNCACRMRARACGDA